MFTILDYSSALEYSIIRRYTNIVYYYYYSNFRLLPNHIVCKITQRDNIREANTCDPALKLLNEEITSDIHKHKQNLWKEHLYVHWDHRPNTHILWKNIHAVYPTKHLHPHSTHFNYIQQQNNNHTQIYCELF